MRIGIDFDDVVVDTIRAIVKLHNEQYGTSFKKEDMLVYDAHETWGGTKDEWHAKLDEFFSTKHFAAFDPMAGAGVAIRELKKAGHELYIVTARAADRDTVITEQWLEKHFPDVFEGVHYGQLVAGDPSQRRLKSELCKENGIEAMIDDQRVNAEDCAAAGIRVFLFDQPWNRGDLPPGVQRVHSWDEIVRNVSSVRSPSAI